MRRWARASFAYEQLQAQLSQLPTEVQARVRKLQTGGRQLDAAAVRSAVENAAEQAAGAYGTYAAQARDTYESLAHRGELVVRRLRRSPEVKETFDKAGDAVADAGKAVSKAEETVTRPGPAGHPEAGREDRAGPEGAGQAGAEGLSSRRRESASDATLCDAPSPGAAVRNSGRGAGRWFGRPRGEGVDWTQPRSVPCRLGGQRGASPLSPLWTAWSAVHSGHRDLPPVPPDGSSDLAPAA